MSASSFRSSATCRNRRQTAIRRSQASRSARTASATTSGDKVGVAVGTRAGAAATGPERTAGPAGLGAEKNIFLYHGLSVVVGGGSAATADAGALTASAAATPHIRNRLMDSPITLSQRAFPFVRCAKLFRPVRGDRSAYANRKAACKDRFWKRECERELRQKTGTVWLWS